MPAKRPLPKFTQHGQTGSWFSELLPNLATHADKLCWLRGLHTDTPAHPQAVVQLHTGSANAALTRPSLGAWLLYGPGSDNQDVPGYVTLNPPPNFGGAVNYGSAFLPAHFQGTRLDDRGRLPNLAGATFLVGAGVKPGFSHGATDDYGIQATAGRMPTNDLHATLLALLGLDHERPTYRYAGRDFRLTDVAGTVAADILA